MAKFVSKENLAYYHSKIKTPLKFAQEEYNKSSNLLDKNKFIVDVNGKIGIDISNLVIGETYTFSSNFPILDFKISDKSNGLLSTGKYDTNGYNTYTFVMSKNSGISSSEKQYLFLGLTETDGQWITSISQLSNYNLQIEKGNIASSYQPYNSNRNITNSQADFLMSEWEKSVNLYQVPNLSSITANGLTWSVTNHLFNVSGKSTGETSINFGDVPLSILKSGEQYKLYSTVPYNGSTFNISIAMQYADGTMDWITPDKITTVKDNLTSARISLYCPSSGISYNYSNVGFTLFKAKYNVSQYYPYEGGEIIHRGDIKPVVLFEGSLNTKGATFNSDFTPYEKLLIHGSFYNETTIFELDLTRKSYAGGYTSSHSSITKNVDAYDSLIVNVNDNKNTFTLVNGGYHTLTKTSFTQHVGYDIFIYKVEGVKSV